MAEAKAFVPYAPPGPAQQETYVPWMPSAPTTAVPPPSYIGKGRDLICKHCEDPIELGDDHIVLVGCVAVPSKKDPSAVVSEFHQETTDIPLHSGCLLGYASDASFQAGDGQVDALVETYFGCSVIPCVCRNCNADVDPDTVPDLLCEHCEEKMTGERG